jgi:DNA ligase (NAD+)
MNAKDEILELRKKIEEYNYAYHVLDNPLVDDFAYDALMRRLRELERENPELATEDSPTRKVGAPPSAVFTPVAPRGAAGKPERCVFL